MIKQVIYIGILIVLSSCSSILSDDDAELNFDLIYDHSEPTIEFAATELKTILVQKGYSVTMRLISDSLVNSNNQKIVLAKKSNVMLNALRKQGGQLVKLTDDQSYSLRATGTKKSKSFWIVGNDRIGAMYGGIHVCEIIKAFGLDSIKNVDHTPYIAKRGLKFNIPMDERQPSHDDSGTAAQSNIENVWDYDFWTEYLDVLARQRYNVLSLWNQHPFPSMVKLKDYPAVALDDVYNKSGKVKSMSIDEKISLWKKVMDYAYDRGIEVYIITWNIHMNGALNKYGITEDKNNKVSIDYLRKSVEQILLTYPKLAGIGVTAGENMGGMDSDEKEEWLWNTYGKGIQDVQALQEDRHIRFIHRFWWTDFDKIDSRFGKLKDGFDMSFKYARARIYADCAPKFAEKELLPILPDSVSTWWNIRNDDIYNLRWGDPEYVRQFILNFPKGDKTAGYYMGSDRYAWGRESISLDPTSPRMLENEKHWYSFLLWGRMGYDPGTSVDLLKGLIVDRFPEASGEDIYNAWSAASKVIPLVNKFHWFSWDYLWWPEAGISTGVGAALPGYHNINDFIDAPVMDYSNLISINDFVKAQLNNDEMEGVTPLQIADSIEYFAELALDLTIGMMIEDSELMTTVGDINAMAYMGKYYSAKIRGALNLKLFRETKDEKYKKRAIVELEDALDFWQDYAQVLGNQYMKMTIAMQGIFDWDALELEVKNDIEIARNAE